MTEPDPKPTVCRSVHYYAPSNDPSDEQGVGPIAAIVTDVNKAGTGCELAFFVASKHGAVVDRKAITDGPRFVEYSEADPPPPHTWRWPPRV